LNPRSGAGDTADGFQPPAGGEVFVVATIWFCANPTGFQCVFYYLRRHCWLAACHR